MPVSPLTGGGLGFIKLGNEYINPNRINTIKNITPESGADNYTEINLAGEGKDRFIRTYKYYGTNTNEVANATLESVADGSIVEVECEKLEPLPSNVIK